MSDPSPSPSGTWQLWIDTGGTFTDCIAEDPSGRLHRLKILSSSVLRGTVVSQPSSRELLVNISWPVTKDIFRGFLLRACSTGRSAKVIRVDVDRQRIKLMRPPGKIEPGSLVELSSGEEVPVLAARFLTHTPIGKPFPLLEMKLGSTRGTNAILEKKGARTAFVVTAGFRDLLLIGNQQRPDLFTLNIQKPEPMYHAVAEVRERIAANGSVLTPLTNVELDSVIDRLRQLKTESVAVALLNAYANPAHEQQISRALRRAGFRYVSVSHELSPQIRLLTRAETTVANAYLDPIIDTYISGIRQALRGASLFVMTSSGSLVRAQAFHPKDSLLSGPAGGVVGAAHQAGKSGVRRLLAFDMGGTSTDVSLFDGQFDYRFESRVGSYSILSPSLAIETIAAGGGSICDFDGHRLLVGPHSAGASPGPACYGAGGPLTITDVNLLMGRLDPAQFAIPLKVEDARLALLALLGRIRKSTGKKPAAREILSALLQIANEKMSDAIRKISVQQGHDPRDFSLLSFGGAGGQHAVALAEILGMRNILVPYDAGLLSAYGIGHASVERFGEKLVLKKWEDVENSLDEVLDQLFIEASGKLIKEGYAAAAVRRRQSFLYLRFLGQDSSIEVPYRHGQSVMKIFRQRYEALYGHWTNRQIEVESLRVVAKVGHDPVFRKGKAGRTYTPAPLKQLRTFSRGSIRSCKAYRWEQLRPGARIAGPALVVSDNSTTFVEAGWVWKLDGAGNALMTATNTKGNNRITRKGPREGELELFTNRFTSIAQEMGALLQRTSFSVNIKERLDFSCALLDADGFLVVNAPHIPVHLGSMGVCVREVRKVIAMEDGDVVVTNHPAYGGSHLPDVTLIKPVFCKGKLVGYVANRAHHAEIGGAKPGSMPAHATRLEEEGVIISPTYLVRKHKPQWQRIEELLTRATHPTRALAENLADLNGALASVNLGEVALRNLCENFGAQRVSIQMKALRSYAAELLAEKIRMLGKKPYRATERLDDGSVLRVRLQRRGNKLHIDFAGSSQVHPGNLNATRAIVQSVVLYCLRLLVNKPLPMNEGMMENVDLRLPAGMLNPDFGRLPWPAVVGGNTEVSQRLTDTILKALGLAACSQGTMNNFLFGNDRFGYYETICGGTGAGPGFHGASGVHQHMTNTRITDPEVLEFRYPVRVKKFVLRKDSGGQGRWHGGDGVVREIEFLANLEVSMLTQHRVERPYGMRGAEAGAPGRQILKQNNGQTLALEGVCQVRVTPGDCLTIETPGGGGWGLGGDD